jgi:hypothetical protein
MANRTGTVRLAGIPPFPRYHHQFVRGGTMSSLCRLQQLNRLPICSGWQAMTLMISASVSGVPAVAERALIGACSPL